MAEPAGRQRVRAALRSATKLELVGGSEADNLHGLPPGCPVVPLGFAGDTRYYLDAKRQLRELPDADHTRTRLLGLFHESKDFIYQQTQWVRQTDDGIITGWRPERVAEDLMASCGRAGMWDPTERERGRGAWRGENDELILHVGDQVLVFERGTESWQGRMALKPGVIRRCVYPLGERVGAPAEKASEGDQPGEELFEILDTWAWRRGDLDATLLLGWICAAMIGGALRWRPAVWLTGGKGTGKSTLHELVKLLFDGALLSAADTSAAGVWQVLSHQSLPVAVDELEADEDNRKQLAVVKLARLAASGGKLIRGSDRHKAHEFTLRSCFMFSSVLMPPLMGPDRSRLAILELQDLPAEQPAPVLEPARIRALGARLRRRMVDGWARFDAAIEYYRRSLSEVGHTARGADQFGTLLACADLALFGDIDATAAYEWVQRMHAGSFSETADDLRDEEECLQFLLGWDADPYRGGEKLKLGEWVNRAAGRYPDMIDQVREAERVIGRYGLRIENSQPQVAGKALERWLAVANNHRSLAQLFAGSRWQTPNGSTGVWVQALRRLPGAERGQKTLYFGGPSAKATLIPLRLVPEPDLQRPLPFDQLRD